MKERKWVDIERKTEPKKFVPMNESEETPTFKYQQGASARDSLKPQILAATLFDAVMKYRSNLVKEGKATNSTNPGFFNRGEWTEFERHGRMIAQFMGAEDDEISGVLANMKETFSKLGGGKGPEAGLERLTNLDKLFSNCGISDLSPKVRASKFLEMLSPDYIGKIKDAETGKTISKMMTKTDGNSEYTYNVTAFIDMIFSRKQRSLQDYLGNIGGKKGITLRQLIDGAFAQFVEDQGETPRYTMDDIMEIFRKLVTANNYSKNNKAVGKAEIALTMFFGDCNLPTDKGDILIGQNKNSKGVKVEVKGNTGIITERVQLINNFRILKNHVWNGLEASGPKAQELLNEVKGMKYEDVIAYLQTVKLKEKELDDALFPILFGALFNQYTSLEGINMFLIFNTDDNLGTSADDSKMLSAKIGKISVPKGRDWYKNGISVLNSLQSQNIRVQFGTAHDSNQGGFKVKF